MLRLVVPLVLVITSCHHLLARDLVTVQPHEGVSPTWTGGEKIALSHSRSPDLVCQFHPYDCYGGFAAFSLCGWCIAVGTLALAISRLLHAGSTRFELPFACGCLVVFAVLCAVGAANRDPVRPTAAWWPILLSPIALAMTGRAAFRSSAHGE